jgi:hypothetical protein
MVFEKDLQEWIESVAWHIAKEISEIEEYREKYLREMEEEKYKDQSKYVNDQNRKKEVFKLIYELAYKIAKDLEDKYMKSKFLLVVQGEFKIGEKMPCFVMEFSRIYDFGWEVAPKIRSKASEILSQHLPQGREIEIPKSLMNPNLENTLDPPIPAIFKPALEDWIIWIPRAIVRKISEGEVYENTEQTMRELLSFEIEKILDELAKLGSQYVAVTSCEYFGYCKGECWIMTIKEFIDKLYKSAYLNTLKALNKKDISYQILDIFYKKTSEG